VAENGRPLGRAGDLAVVRERFAEHPRGLFSDGTQSAFDFGSVDASNRRSGWSRTLPKPRSWSKAERVAENGRPLGRAGDL